MHEDCRYQQVVFIKMKTSYFFKSIFHLQLHLRLQNVCKACSGRVKEAINSGFFTASLSSHKVNETNNAACYVAEKTQLLRTKDFPMVGNLLAVPKHWQWKLFKVWNKYAFHVSNMFIIKLRLCDTPPVQVGVNEMLVQKHSIRTIALIKPALQSHEKKQRLMRKQLFIAVITQVIKGTNL